MAKEKKLGISHFINTQLKPINGYHPLYMRLTYNRDSLKIKSPTYSILEELGKLDDYNQERIKDNDIRIVHSIHKNVQDKLIGYSVKTFKDELISQLYRDLGVVHYERLYHALIDFLETNSNEGTAFFLDHYTTGSLDEIVNSFLDTIEELNPELFIKFETEYQTHFVLDEVLKKHSLEQNWVYVSVADVLFNKDLLNQINQKHKHLRKPFLDLQKLLNPFSQNSSMKEFI